LVVQAVEMIRRSEKVRDEKINKHYDTKQNIKVLLTGKTSILPNAAAIMKMISKLILILLKPP